MTDRQASETSGEERLRGLLALMEQTSRDRRESEPLERRYPALADVEVRDLVVAGPHGPIPARRYRGPAEEGVGLVWVHGGGFVAGDLDMAEAHWVSLALASRGVFVLSLDHQKALGGVHHPIPSDEILAGWLAAASDPGLLDVPIERLHLGGASAGACLSAGVALRLASGAGPRPATLTLVYPLVHAELPEAQPEAAAAAAALPPELRFTPDFVRALNVNYVGRADLLDDPIAFPASGYLGGLPPTYIINAEADDLRSSGEAFAAMLRTAGVPVRVEYEPGTVHGYLDKPEEPAATRTVERLRTWFEGAPPSAPDSTPRGSDAVS